MTNLLRVHTDIQYKQNTRLKDDDNNTYQVMSSLDLFWLYKTEEMKGKYLTVLKPTGKLIVTEEVKNDATSKKPNTTDSTTTDSGVH